MDKKMIRKMFILACILLVNLIVTVNGYTYDLLEYYPIEPGSTWHYDVTSYDNNSQTSWFFRTKRVQGSYFFY